MKIRLADTRGFCAGVDRAIEIVKKVLEVNGAPVYVKHEVVHNKTVVNELKSLGAVFVEEIDEAQHAAAQHAAGGQRGTKGSKKRARPNKSHMARSGWRHE